MNSNLTTTYTAYTGSHSSIRIPFITRRLLLTLLCLVSRTSLYSAPSPVTTHNTTTTSAYSIAPAHMNAERLSNPKSIFIMRSNTVGPTRSHDRVIICGGVHTYRYPNAKPPMWQARSSVPPLNIMSTTTVTASMCHTLMLADWPWVHCHCILG